ncbi:MAG: hypothetical protein H0X35_13390, partial [Pseudonocardiales bacterium]|nr:hypothetical protein [Pseudonocardiales bacterium]
MTTSAPGCEGHAGASAELRALAVAALDRLEPALDRLRIEPPTPTSPSTCAICPICALMAALRGERPELVARVAEHAGGLITLLRDALAESEADFGPEDAPTERTASGSPRLVQRITV